MTSRDEQNKPESLPTSDAQPATSSASSTEGAASTDADDNPWDRGLRMEDRSWLVRHGELGRGGMGRVDWAEDKRLRRQVAVKELLAGTDLHARVRFVEEAQITAQLDHPHIPPVHDLCLSSSGKLSFTMKLVRGRTLSAVLESMPPSTRTERQLEELLAIFGKVCDAVAFAHSRGVLHRDIKPDNIMVGSHGQVYLMDWGCAALVPDVVPTDGPTLTLARYAAFEEVGGQVFIVGTANYMAPEQAVPDKDEIGVRTDVYLLGALLYCILTGQPPRPPVPGPDGYRAARNNEIREPESLPTPVSPPPALMNIVWRAMSSLPEARFADVPALKAAILEAQEQGWWFTTLQVPAGTNIIREGEEGHAAYIIQAGVCEVYRVDAGHVVMLRRLGRGEVFGETAIFTSQPRIASVRAVTDVTLTVLTRDALERAISARSWVGLVVRTVAGRFAALMREYHGA